MLYTRPKFERKVSTFLHENEITHFLPTSKILKIWKDRRKLVDVPLFPSYIFVYLSSYKQYFKVLETKGVMCYVKCGKEIVRINETMINGLRSIIDIATDVVVSNEKFKFGEHVLIKDGALKGLACEIVKYNGNSKVLIRLDILNRNVLVDLPVTLLHTA